MFGQLVEWLKNPKQPIAWIITGWVLCIVGYAVFAHWNIEPAGQIVAFLGLVAILLMLVRLSATKLIYAVICGVLFLTYVGFYRNGAKWSSSEHKAEIDEPGKERVITQWLPTYSDSKTKQKVMTAVFAPAAMSNVILSGKLKGSDIEQWVQQYDEEVLKASDLGGLVEDGKKRRGR